MNQLNQKQQAITKAITAFVKEANKQGEAGIISAGLNNAIFAAFNQPKDCLTSKNLELLHSSLNNWHKGNEELLKAFTQANELND
jgi:hypothetical protein